MAGNLGDDAEAAVRAKRAPDEEIIVVYLTGGAPQKIDTVVFGLSAERD
jgi:hypothetical protein